MPDIRKIFLVATASLALIVTLTTLALVVFNDFFLYTTWGDRALERTRGLSEVFQSYGAEYGARQGQRTPGGGLYYYLYGLTQISASPLFVYTTTLVLHFLSAVLIFVLGRKLHSSLAGAFALLAYLTSLSIVDVAWNMWNPLFAIPFGMLAFYCFYDSILRLSPERFLAGVAIACFAAQMHIAYLLLVAGFIIADALFIHRLQTVHYLAALGIAAIIYSPWLLSLAGGLPGDGVPVNFSPGVTLADAGQRVMPAEQLPGFLFQAKTLLLNLIEAFEFAGVNHLRVDVPVTPFILAGVMLLAFRGADNHLSDAERRVKRHAPILATIILVPVVAVFIVGTLVHGPGIKLEVDRYIIQMLPAAALLSGLALASLFDIAIERRTIFCVVVFSLFAAGLFGKTAFVLRDNIRLGISYPAHYPGWMLAIAGADIPYRDRAALFDQLQNDHGPNLNIAMTTASLTRSDAGWRVVSSPSEYMLAQQSGATSTWLDAECSLVFWRQTRGAAHPTEARDARVAAQLLETDGLQVGHQVLRGMVLTQSEHADYFLVRYRPQTPSCLKSFNNPYVMSPEEQLTESYLQANPTPLHEIRLDAAPGKRYLVRVDVPGSAYPLNAMIDINAKSGGAVTATLHSKQLSNFATYLNGYWAPLFLDAPDIVFKTATGIPAAALTLSEGPLGLDGAITPWQTDALQLPAGTYQVFLQARAAGPRDDYQSGTTVGIKPISIKLSDAFTIPLN